MSRDLVLTNANVVMADHTEPATVRVVNGIIEAIDPGRTEVSHAVDLEGDYLIPGLIDIHTDNLERHLRPRPGVEWPNLAALLTHDRQMAAAGVTTVFDSLCVGVDYHGRSDRRDALVFSLQAMERAQADGLLKAEHFLHLRCEVTSPSVVESFSEFVNDPYVRLVSVMDHTLGQRQWSDVERWRQFTGEPLTDAEISAKLDAAREVQRLYSAANRQAVVDISQSKGLVLASHDDATPDHVQDAVRQGVGISEFPTTEEAARAARQGGMWVVMGAPNVVLGGSHSGNVSARALAEHNLVDGLASDYVPVSLIHGCFLFHEVLGLKLSQAVATVTAKPAAMLNLADRGELAPGKRADLVWVKAYKHTPVIRGVWREGQMVA